MADTKKKPKAKTAKSAETDRGQAGTGAADAGPAPEATDSLTPAEREGEAEKDPKAAEREELRAKIRDIKADLKTIANKMIRAKNIGEQNTLKNDQRTMQRELVKLQSRLKQLR